MKNLIILILCSFMVACAATSQDAKINIYPSVEQSNMGAGIPVFIIVDDARSSVVMGRMGGDKQMFTSQDLAETIGTALVESFKKKGFDVGSSGNQGATEILVSLEELSFSKDGNLVSTTVETTSRVKVDVSNKGFVRTYSNQEERTIPFSANEDSNNSQISATLGALIEKIVNDPDLLAAMVK